MAETQMKEKVLKGLFWKILENGGAQGIQFVIAILLARLLTPAEYGLVGIIMIFITISNVVVQYGFPPPWSRSHAAMKRIFPPSVISVLGSPW